MKVFISSLIKGYEPLRQAARTAVTTLRHQPIMAEDFGAQPDSPQIACLKGLRQADVVVLILVGSYGTAQGTSGISPTHEEFREAKGAKPILLFVQENTAREPAQQSFVSEVQGWENGLFRGSFKEAADLQIAATQALHDYELSKAVAPLDVPELLKNALALLPSSRARQSHGFSDDPMLSVALVSGPLQRVLRPVELEAPELREAIHREGLFGKHRLFDQSKGMTPAFNDTALTLDQEDGASFQLSEQGALLIRLPLNRAARDGAREGLPVLIEERVFAQLSAALGFSAWVLDHIDSTQRLSHVAIAVAIDGADHLAWRSQKEQDASPRSVSMRSSGGGGDEAIQSDRSRAALRLDQLRLAEDLLVLLRRKRKRNT